MTALNAAYASNAETPLITIEFLHPSLENGAIRLVQGYYPIYATLEGENSPVIFNHASMSITLPQRSADGRQEIDIQISNTSNDVWQALSTIVKANRISETPVVCKYRPYLESDLSSPAGATYAPNVTGATINRVAANIRASYAYIYDVAYPRRRYYPTKFPGVRYA